MTLKTGAIPLRTSCKVKKNEHGHAPFLVERTSIIIFVHSQGGRGVLAIIQQINDSPLSAFADNSVVCIYLHE
jgi:hypothetical protein